MADQLGSSVVITALILSMLVLMIIAKWTVSRRRRAALSRTDDIPLLAVPAAPTQVARPSHTMPEHWRRPAPQTTMVGSGAGLDPLPQPARAYSPPSSSLRSSPSDEFARPAGMVPSPDYDETGEPIEGASVRYWRAADGTLQFLPGRLELAAGQDAGQEIRFVRTAGPDGTTITFGRAEGLPYRHVQLREPTVSRQHARMSLEQTEALGANNPQGARWRLENLSATNPVIVNGRSLTADAGARSSVILSDGDRIEMGEVAFIFRSR